MLCSDHVTKTSASQLATYQEPKAAQKSQHPRAKFLYLFVVPYLEVNPKGFTEWTFGLWRGEINWDKTHTFRSDSKQQ